jgi:hypothetical protein
MKIDRGYLLLPLVGVVVFVILYYISTLYYPGGSDVDTNYIGFDWKNNYWCDLTDEITESGAENPARPVAIFAMFVLCLSIAYLSYIIPPFFRKLKFSFLISYFGISSMVAANFVFTEFHSSAAYISGILGIIPLALAYYGLYKHRHKMLFVFGIISLFFLALNFFIYVTKIHIEILPLIQKFTFLAFLIWIGMLNIEVYKNLKSKVLI